MYCVHLTIPAKKVYILYILSQAIRSKQHLHTFYNTGIVDSLCSHALLCCSVYVCICITSRQSSLLAHPQVLFLYELFLYELRQSLSNSRMIIMIISYPCMSGVYNSRTESLSHTPFNNLNGVQLLSVPCIMLFCFNSCSLIISLATLISLHARILLLHSFYV